jgi:hypothetical protein
MKKNKITILDNIDVKTLEYTKSLKNTKDEIKITKY